MVSVRERECVGGYWSGVCGGVVYSRCLRSLCETGHVQYLAKMSVASPHTQEIPTPHPSPTPQSPGRGIGVGVRVRPKHPTGESANLVRRESFGAPKQSENAQSGFLWWKKKLENREVS